MTKPKETTGIAQKYQQALASTFPEYADWTIEMQAVEIDDLDSMPMEIYDDFRTVDDVMWDSQLFEEALRKHMVTCRAPKGYLLTRIVKKGEQPVLLVLPSLAAKGA